MQRDKRMRPREAQVECALNPAFRPRPVLGNDIPEHAGVRILEQVIEGFAVEETPIELPTSAKRPEKAPRVGKISDQRFRPFDLGYRNALFSAHAEWHKVIISVIADLMTLGMSAFCKMASFAHLLSQNEEG